MKLVIIGVGRMGMRHALGASKVKNIEKIYLVDINNQALDSAKQYVQEKLDSNTIFSYSLLEDFFAENIHFDTAIIATTADSRLEIIKECVNKNCQNILVEKPLGQSREEIFALYEACKYLDVDISVNLNMRLYKFIQELKSDLLQLPQFQGEKTITLNTGTIGIGANGIHYLDLLFFLLDADEATVVGGEIDEHIIPSGRGAQFGDHGGWCAIKFYKAGQYLGKALLSISAHSTVFGGWDFVGPHGRIRINEIEGTRVDILRKPESELPIYRYAADYLPPITKKIESPFLDTLTEKWLNELIQGNNILPSIEASLKVHELMFDWLEKNAKEQLEFRIT